MIYTPNRRTRKPARVALWTAVLALSPIWICLGVAVFLNICAYGG